MKKLTQSREPIIRPGAIYAAAICREPPGPPVGECITYRNVRLDVEERGPVKDIDARDEQAGPLPFEELHDRKADRIRATGSAGGKDPVRPGVEEGNDFKPGSARAMEMVHQDDPGEALDILQSCGIIGDRPPRFR